MGLTLGMFLSLLVSFAVAADPQLWSASPTAPAEALIVRTGASPAAQVAGALPAGATGIVELEQSGDGWMRVRAGTVEGWVSGVSLVPQAPPSGYLPTALTCSGTEPFWSIQLEAGQGKVQSPDRPTSPELPFDQLKTPHEPSFLVTPRGKGAGYRWLTVSLAREQCQDGMSEQRYGWRALALTAEQGFVAGCCRVPK